MNAGQEERLVGVDVADAGHDGLVEQQRFHGRPASMQSRAQHLGGEAPVQRFGPELAGHTPEIAHQPDAAELARVGEGQPLASGQVEPGTQMRSREDWIVAAHHFEPAGHAQVDDQRFARVQPDDQVFGAAPHIDHDPVADALIQGNRVGLGQRARPEDVCGDETLADQVRAQLGGKGFDFREFGHEWLYGLVVS